MINKDWIFELNSFALGKAKLENDPEGWGEQLVSISRSPSFFGLFRTFKSTLRFEGDGYQYVRNVYEIEGTEHEIQIKTNQYVPTLDRFELYYQGVIDLSTYVTDEDIFADVVINDSSFARKIKSRDDVKVNLSRTKSIEGTILPENNQVTVNLHQRELLSVGEFALNAAVTIATSTVVNTGGTDWDGFTLPITLNANNSDVDNLSSQNVPTLGELEGTLWRPASQESIASFAGRIAGRVRDSTAATFGKALEISFRLRVYVDNTLAARAFDVPLTTNISIPAGTAQDPIPWADFDFTFDTTLGQDTRITTDNVISLIAVDVGTATAETIFNAEFTQTDLTVGQNLQWKDGTPAQGYLMFEAFQRVIQVITDKELSFKSDYLDRIDRGAAVNGPGAFETLHSSLQIRQIPGTNPSVSLKELFTSLNAQNNLGLGIEFNEVGQPFVRLEEKAHFFSGEVVLTIHSVSELEKSVARDYIYSSIKVGYDKSATEEVNGLEEYNNKFDFDTRINTFKNELDLVSKIRWDGYGIEKMRRLSYQTNPTEDTREDNDTFGVVVLEDGVDGSGNKKYKSAKDEAYDLVENIFSPETAYNLDHTPGRMLRENGGIIRPGLEKYLDDEIVFGFAEQKEDLRSQKTGESLIVENANIDVKTLNTGLWIPEMYSFKSGLTRDQFVTLTRRSGGIIKFSTTSEDNTTEYKYGWLIDLDQESDKQEAEWKLLRVNIHSPEVTLIDPEGNTPNVPIPPVDPSPIYGVFDGSFPFVFVGEDPNEAYNFTGIEKISVSGVPDFERTSTLYFVANIINKESGNQQILWDNLATNNRGLSISIDFSDKLSIRLQNTSVGFNTLLVVSDDTIPVGVSTKVEIWYDGSSLASGVTMNINDSLVTTTDSFDQLTATTLTGANGYSFGVQKNNAVVRGEYVLDDMGITIDGTEQFNTDCANNDPICVDDSGQGNDGSVDRSTSTEEEFYITV